MIKGMVGDHCANPVSVGSSHGAGTGDGKRGAPAKQEHARVDYRMLFERIGDAILVMDASGRCIAANPAAGRMTGYTQDELGGIRLWDLAPSAEGDAIREHLAEAAKTGRATRACPLACKDGTHPSVELQTTELGDGTYLCRLRRASQRIEEDSSDAGRSSLDTFGTLVRLYHVAVISAGANGRITSWNPAAQALLGYTTEEAVGMPITKLIPQAKRRKHLSGFKRQIQSASQEPFDGMVQSEAIRKDGTKLHVELAIAGSWQGAEPMLTAVIRDVTAHRELVEQLNDALQRLQFHVERMPLAYIVWNADFCVEEWNPAAQRMFGYSRAEAIGRNAVGLVIPSDVIPIVKPVWERLLKGDASSHSINDNVRKDGTRFTCEWFNTPLRDAAGNVHAVASMAMDVSEREALASRLRDAQRLEALGSMASGVAHDFNSSLMVILGNTSLLRKIKGLPSEAMDLILPIEDAGARASDLIRHLLAYARTGRHNPQPTDLNAVIEDAMGFVTASVGKQHEFDLRLASRLPTILADCSQIERILLNLCINAKQAMEKSGTIGITTRRTKLTQEQVARCVPPDRAPGSYVELLVSDTGCGMDKTTVGRIFDPFFTTKAEGHGLGLAAVLGIFRQHNGMALVESKVGKGTKIHVFFPVHKEDRRRTKRTRTTTAGRARRGVKKRRSG
ncbi:MAG: PAS domain S-box protein [Planctomycetes bacterium]|nr:PAS domain S-box protein [Planctomycetota bacterium]